MHRSLQPMLDPKVRLVIGHRGWGKSRLVSELIDGCVPWGPASAEGFYCVDVAPGDDPHAALVHARESDKRCRMRCPKVQVKTFMRVEHWEAIKGYNKWMPNTAIWELPLPIIAKAEYPLLRDMRGALILWAADRASSIGDLEAAQKWTVKQPEHEWLQAALPLDEQRGYKIPITLTIQRMSAWLDRHPQTHTGGHKTPREFLRFCELIGAGRRVEAAWEWAPIWLTGCREIFRHHG